MPTPRAAVTHAKRHMSTRFRLMLQPSEIAGQAQDFDLLIDGGSRYTACSANRNSPASRLAATRAADRRDSWSSGPCRSSRKATMQLPRDRYFDREDFAPIFGIEARAAEVQMADPTELNLCAAGQIAAYQCQLVPSGVRFSAPGWPETFQLVSPPTQRLLNRAARASAAAGKRRTAFQVGPDRKRRSPPSYLKSSASGPVTVAGRSLVRSCMRRSLGDKARNRLQLPQTKEVDCQRLATRPLPRSRRPSGRPIALLPDS